MPEQEQQNPQNPQNPWTPEDEVRVKQEVLKGLLESEGEEWVKENFEKTWQREREFLLMEL